MYTLILQNADGLIEHVNLKPWFLYVFVPKIQGDRNPNLTSGS